jgi:hypothetical protein
MPCNFLGHKKWRQKKSRLFSLHYQCDQHVSSTVHASCSCCLSPLVLRWSRLAEDAELKQALATDAAEYIHRAASQLQSRSQELQQLSTQLEDTALRLQMAGETEHSMQKSGCSRG